MYIYVYIYIYIYNIYIPSRNVINQHNAWKEEGKDGRRREVREGGKEEGHDEGRKEGRGVLRKSVGQ